MKANLRNLKPTSGFSYLLHLSLVLVLPVAVFILVRLNFVQLALAVVVLSKWRMFAVRPRFWAANIRANAVDLMVGLSLVLFMTHSGSVLMQFLWAIAYVIWLLAIKPRSTMFMVATQAFIGQLCALTALYLVWADGPVAGLTLLSGLFCFLAARHFFDIFDEPYARLLAYSWGYFGTALAWLTSHMLITYPKNENAMIAQPVLFLSVIGYGLGVLYYLQHFDRLSKLAKRQTLAIMLIISFVLVISLYIRTRHLVA